MTIDQQTEDALQTLADDIEMAAELLRARAWRGREKGTLGDVSHQLSEFAAKVGALVKDSK